MHFLRKQVEELQHVVRGRDQEFETLELPPTDAKELQFKQARIEDLIAERDKLLEELS